MSLGGSNPYTEKNLDKMTFEREFSVAENSDEFVWHRDREDRLVEIISGVGWRFQRDNCLPVHLNPGDKFAIEKNEWHRIIKGDTNLVIKVIKCL